MENTEEQDLLVEVENSFLKQAKTIVEISGGEWSRTVYELFYKVFEEVNDNLQDIYS